MQVHITTFLIYRQHALFTMIAFCLVSLHFKKYTQTRPILLASFLFLFLLHLHANHAHFPLIQDSDSFFNFISKTWLSVVIALVLKQMQLLDYFTLALYSSHLNLTAQGLFVSKPRTFRRCQPESQKDSINSCYLVYRV